MNILIKCFKGFIKIICDKYKLSSHNLEKYTLAIDGFYYCKKTGKTIAVIRVRNRRNTEKISVQELVKNRKYIEELHPIDACIAGILANDNRNGFVDSNIFNTGRFNRIKEYPFHEKEDPFLAIAGKYTNSHGDEIIVLYSKNLNREISIPVKDLFANKALIYALNSVQAASVGYQISESKIK